jgi:hypothetical protein
LPRRRCRRFLLLFTGFVDELIEEFEDDWLYYFASRFFYSFKVVNRAFREFNREFGFPFGADGRFRVNAFA